MNKQAGGRPAKSGARRELKTFRLVPEAISNLERLADERNASISDVLNEMLMGQVRATAVPDGSRPRRFDVLGNEASGPRDNVRAFRVLPGNGRSDASPVNQQLERLRDALAGVLLEMESLMAEQLGEDSDRARPGDNDEFASGFRAGMLEGLETAHSLLQAELLIAT